MSVARILVLNALFLFCSLASAQSYAIRIAFDTNLRAAASLQARVVETAPAGTSLNVIGSDNRWLRVNRNGSEVYMADWVTYTRVESSGETQSALRPASNIDNCCFVDRQCHSNEDWINGYQAFQNGQCAAPAVTQTQTSTQPNTSQVDNCCYLDWNCASDDDWLAGFHAFRLKQCLHRGLAIEGNKAFVAKIERALDILKRRAPAWYDYSIRGLDKIKEVPASVHTGVHVAGRTFNISPIHTVDRPGERTALWLAGIIVHDACHVHQFEAGLAYSHLAGERACLEIQLEALALIYPNTRDPFGLRVLLENIEDPEYQWWLD
ncbi:MAG: SH3 domain-containing protein [Chloroflexota bacterium]|nr:SH3 domain-containing protein [Chloroflexota bacterium]